MRAAAKAAPRTRAWEDLVGLFVGTREDLAALLGVSRQSLWSLLELQHARQPNDLLRKFTAALREPVDGSPAPTLAEVMRLWREAKVRT